jgi:hypothetical protein
MVIPTTALKLDQPLDPSDVDLFGLDISQGVQGVAPFPILAPGENVASFNMAPLPESVALGFAIKSGNGYSLPTLVGRRVSFWPEIVDAMKESPLFDTPKLIGIVVTITTDAVPPRVKQRTFTLEYQHQ